MLPTEGRRMEERDSYEGWPRAAAVIGAGTMGLGVAECFAAAGVGVRLTPPLSARLLPPVGGFQ